MKKLIQRASISSLGILNLASTMTAKAATGAAGPPPPAPVPVPKGGVIDPSVLVMQVLWWLLATVGAVAVAYLVYGGFLFITSGGDEKKVGVARNTILYAIVGIIVVLISLGIINWATSF